MSSCRRVGAVRRCEPYRRDPRPARHADPARRSLPRRGGSVGGRGSALRAAALGGPSGRCEPERARRGEPDGELQLHAGPHRRAAAVSVRAVRTGRAGHREYRLRLSVRSACRSAARTVGAVRPLRLDAQLRSDRRAVARGGPAHHRQHGREPDRSADAVRTARIGLHRGDAFRRGARLWPRSTNWRLPPSRAAGLGRFPSRPPRPEARPLPPRTMSAAGSSQPLSFRWTVRGESRR